MKILFTDRAWEDYVWWQEQPAGLAKVNKLIEECRRSPFTGLGKPEPLKKDFAGYRSRRITGEHRLIYRVEGRGVLQQLELMQCRFHYD